MSKVNNIEERMEKLIKSKLNKDFECSLNRKSDNEEFFLKSYDRGGTYHLYMGCDLIVGDVPLCICVQALLRGC